MGGLPSKLLRSARRCSLGGLLAASSLIAAAQVKSQAILELPIVNGVVPVDLRLIKVRQGAALRWRVSSSTAGVVHLHAYRLSAQLHPGQTIELAFVAHASGRFRLEWHGAGEKSATAGGHHAPPLAILEVRPH